MTSEHVSAAVVMIQLVVGAVSTIVGGVIVWVKLSSRVDSHIAQTARAYDQIVDDLRDIKRTTDHAHDRISEHLRDHIRYPFCPIGHARAAADGHDGSK